MRCTILDGPIGTQLLARGVDLDGPGWSAVAVRDEPALISQIHAEYAEAGATVHTTATFRTTARALGEGWRELAQQAVQLTRAAIPSGQLVAGSVAPLEDCYRPDLSPGGGADVQREHAALAAVLADAGCDLLLCETFSNEEEASAAVRACAETGVETWVALTAGYRVDLMTPVKMAVAARRAVDAGAAAVLVSCTAVGASLGYVLALESARLGVPIGVYANCGMPGRGGPGRGTSAHSAVDPTRYAAVAQRWVDAGATLIGACCGGGPEHVRALADACD